MLHLGNELKANLYKITSIYPKEIQQILNEFDEIVSKEPYDIGNFLTIEHIIRLITEVSVVRKIGYHILKEYKWIED